MFKKNVVMETSLMTIQYLFHGQSTLNENIRGEKGKIRKLMNRISDDEYDHLLQKKKKK